MPEMTVAEFVDELVAELEDRLEGHFTPVEELQLRALLEGTVRRLDGEKLDA